MINVNDLIPHIGEYTEKGNEIIPKHCPFCHGGSHHDKHTFAVNMETGAYNCKRGGCEAQGGLFELARHFGMDANRPAYFRETRKPKKVYKPAPVNDYGLSAHVVSYFEKRKISKETLIVNRVKSDEKNNIVFNYYNENDCLTFIKYKLSHEPKKYIDKDGKECIQQKSWREAGTKPILYGMDRFVDSGVCVIVEGEPDKLSLDEAGINNVLSIPSGSNDFDWVEHCWDYMERFQEIIIWTDNDKGGKICQQNLIAKFDDWKLRVVKCVDYKDANEALVKRDAQYVRDMIYKAEIVKKQNITDLSDVKRVRNSVKYRTGYNGLDIKLGGFFGGQLVVWTGYNGGGKSSFISNILLNIMDDGQKVFAYSGELPKEDFKEWVDLQATGKKHLGSEFCEVKQQQLPALKECNDDALDEWYRGMFFLFDSENYATDTEVVKAMEYMAKRENVKHFLVDNMMTTVVEGRGEENEKQTRFINTLKRFARKHTAVVHLVAHPRKPEKGQTKVDKYSISGTANISNLADRVIAVHRIKAEDVTGYDPKGKDARPELEGYSTLVIVFKDRKYGAVDFDLPLKFDFFTKRFYENDAQLKHEYGWTKHIKKSNAISNEFIKDDEREWWEES